MDTKKPHAPEGSVRTMQSDQKHVLDDSGIVFSDHGTPQGEANTQTTKKPVDASVFDVSGAFRGETEMGTFVTDKKRKRRTIFGVIKEAAGEWTKDKTDSVKNMEVFQKPEVPTVAPGSKRKEVLEKALQNKAALPRDDHKVVVERIKTLEHDAERITGKPFQIKPKEERVVKAGWSTASETPPETGRITTEHIAPVSVRRAELTPDAANQNAAPQTDERVNKTLDDYTKKPTLPGEIHRADIASGTESGTVAEETDRRTPIRTFDEPLVTPEKSNLEERWQNFNKKEMPVAKTAPAVTPPPPLSAPLPTRDESAQRTSPLRTLIIVLVILISIGSGIGGAVLLVMQNKTGEVPLPILITTGGTFMNVDERISLPLSADRTTLLRVLADTVKAEANNTIVVDFTRTNGAYVSTEEFMTVLVPRVPGAFTRSLLPEMMAGSIPGITPTPYFIFKTDSFDTAFAGMLDWEPFISADLAPLFGTPVSRSLNQDARTSDKTTSALFVDANVGNHNVRILLDEVGNERIVYGILGIDTLVITTTRKAFEDIVAALK